AGERSQPVTAVCLHVVVTGKMLLRQEPFQVLEQDRDYRRDGQTTPTRTDAAVIVCAATHEGECGRGAIFQRLPFVLAPEKVPGEAAFPQ
ncbi:hypothetical protein AVEN_272140-1, partial [Araneus ventricosus]